jgi:hypothetical protein
VEVSHTNLSEVTRMVLVHVGSVVMLTTSKTTTTGMLAVLSYTSVSGRDMAAAMKMSVQCTTKFLTRLKLRPGAHPLSVLQHERGSSERTRRCEGAIHRSIVIDADGYKES